MMNPIRTAVTTIVFGGMIFSAFGDPIEERTQPPKLQRRLATLEMESLFFFIERPLAKPNPKFKKKEKEMETLSRLPGIRSSEYRNALQDKRKEIEDQIAKLRASGLGKIHPQVLMNKDKMEVIDSLLKEKTDKS